jgi:hypothetical protein
MLRTFLEDRGPVHPHDCGIAIFVFLAVTHGERGQLLSFMNCRRRALGIVAVDVGWLSRIRIKSAGGLRLAAAVLAGSR